MIQSAQLLLAELTEKNANVFYELGLAHAIGKPVILISETIVDVPFDLQALRVILYDKNDPSWGARLRQTIAAAITETMEDVASAVPVTFRKPVRTQAPPESRLSARLRALEQQLTSMRQVGVPGPPAVPTESPHSLSELHARFAGASGRAEAVLIAQQALRSWKVPLAFLKDVLRDVFGLEESNYILS